MSVSSSHIKGFFAAFALVVVLAMSPTSASAQTAHSTCDPKCDPDVCAKMQNHSNSMRSRDQGLVHNTVIRNDSTLGLTCFDQGMTQTSKAGFIFSDPHWISPISVFKPGGPTIYNPLMAATANFAQYAWDVTVMGPAGPGTTDTLANDLETVIFQPLNEMLQNFTQSLMNLVMGILGSIIGWVYNAIQMAFMAIGLIGSPIAQLIIMLIDGLFAFACDYMQQLWDTAIIGQGNNAGNPFFSFQELFQLQGGLPGAGALMSTLFGNEGAQLTNAFNDLIDLNTPGSAPWFKTPPLLPAGSPVAAIIGAM